MVEIDEELQPLRDDRVGLGALDVGDKADAARVMLVARIVKTLFRRQTHQKPQPRHFGAQSRLPLATREKPGNAQSS